MSPFLFISSSWHVHACFCSCPWSRSCPCFNTCPCFKACAWFNTCQWFTTCCRAQKEGRLTHAWSEYSICSANHPIPLLQSRFILVPSFLHVSFTYIACSCFTPCSSVILLLVNPWFSACPLVVLWSPATILWNSTMVAWEVINSYGQVIPRFIGVQTVLIDSLR